MSGQSTELAKNETKSKSPMGELAARQIISAWRGSCVADACIAATQLGLLQSGNMLSYERATTLLRVNFDLREVDDIHWSTVHESFRNGRSTVISNIELRNRYLPAAANDNQRFQITWFDDVSEEVTKDDIVKGFLGAGEFSLFVAKPGTAKSVLLCDIGCHIAAGRDWHGRKVKQGLVVFFAAERKSLTQRRVAAWRKKHGIAGIPFVVVGGKLDLTGGLLDAKLLAATIKTLEAKCGHECGLVIVDTVTRTFGGGDQNASKDMQRYIQSVDELHRATGAHVAAVHHSGWEGDRGKGAIDLDGAVDVSFGVTVKGLGPSKVFTLECTGANDGEEGVVTSFRLDSVGLGADADGNVTTAPVVVQADTVPCRTDGSNLKGNAAKALETLRAAIGQDGESPPAGSPGFPEGVRAVTKDAWRNRFLADAWAKEPKATEETLSKRFRRAVVELTESEAIGSSGQWFWLDSRTSADMSGH